MAGLGGRRRWLIFAAVAMAVVAGLALWAVRQHWLEARLARELEARLGVPVDIGSLGLGKGAQAVLVRGLRIGPSRSPLVAIDTVEVAAASLPELLAGRIDRIRAQGVAWRPASSGEASPAWSRMAGEGAGGGGAEIVVEGGVLALDMAPDTAGRVQLAHLRLHPAGDGEMRLSAEGSVSLNAPAGLRGAFSVDALIDPAGMIARAVDVVGRAAVPGFADAPALRLRVGELGFGAGGLTVREAGMSAIVVAADRPPVGIALSLPESIVAAERTASTLLSLAATMDSTTGLWASLQALEADASSLRVARLVTRMSARAKAVPLELVASASLAFDRSAAVLASGLTAVRLAVALDSPEELLLRGRGAVQWDFGAATAEAHFSGSFDDAPMTLDLGYLADRTPPFSIVGALQRLDLGRIPAQAFAADGDGGRGSGDAVLPDWPLVLDLRVAHLEGDDLLVEDARLRYRPGAHNRAE